MDYRVVASPSELTLITDLEIITWGMDAREALPVNIIRALIHNGGVAIGAFDGEHLIGAAVAFPARRPEGWLLWSHLAGVAPAYQRSGVGFRLKQLQRSWALEHGYEEMRWTFDPLLRDNANFNLRRLGVVTALYHDNFYGSLPSSVSLSTSSDRLEVIWRLRDARVQHLAGHEPAPPPYPFTEQAALLLVGADGRPQPGVPTRQAPHYFAQIPRDRALLRVHGEAWRLALRAALRAAFAQGLYAVDFFDLPGTGVYVLAPLS